MKLIIAGSRDIDLDTAWQAIVDWFQDNGSTIPKVEEIVSGTARGVDRLGEYWANKYRLKVKQFPADWDNKGRAAGIIRNADMAKYADALLLVWDGKSRGSANMRDQMKKL